jgi:DNA-binding ferritin-like protein
MIMDKLYGRDLYDYHEVFDEQYFEMHDVFD